MSYIKDYTSRIDASEIASGVNGEPAYVVVKTRLKNKWINAYQRAQIALGALMSMKEGDDLSDVPDQADEVFKAVFGAYAAFVVRWNWIDEETGEPLPQPTGQIIQDELYNNQVKWIRDRFDEFLKFRGTEGNGMNTGG
jgi:hypothetical protein